MMMILSVMKVLVMMILSVVMVLVMLLVWTGDS